MDSSTLASASFQSNCLTLGEALDSIPQVSNWTRYLRSAGLGSVLLDVPDSQVTLLVPVNSALNAQISPPYQGRETLGEIIIAARQAIINPLVAYSVLPELYPTYSFTPGLRVNTSASVDKVNPLQITVVSPNSLVGLDPPEATILQGDIKACGPSVIHIIDQILLPFSFNQGATDAVLGTAVQAAG